MSSKEKITFCVPTLNRADFVVRLLNYFVDTKYTDWIFIGDSSDESNLDKTREHIKSLEGRLKIRHFECPGLSVAGAIEHMNQFITTPYCVILADDDFLCVNGVNQCIDFLEDNPDYGAAHGTGIATRVAGGGLYGDISHVSYYQQATLNADSGSQRLRDYFNEGPYVLLYSVHRVRDWRAMHQGLMSKPWARQGFLFDELIVSCVSSIRNKVKELDCLYLVRFGHDRIYRQVDAYHWFTDKDWFPGFKDLHGRAITELMRQDNISEEEAEEVFRQAFSPYLARLFNRLSPSIRQSSLQRVVLRIKQFAARIPGVEAAYGLIMSRLRRKTQVNLLPSLLSPSSPYNENFIPVYRAITTPMNNIERQET